MSEKKRTKTFTGWVSKEYKDLNLKNTYDSEFHPIYKTRGLKRDWPDDAWPPIKVKLTVEIV